MQINSSNEVVLLRTAKDSKIVDNTDAANFVNIIMFDGYTEQKEAK